VGAGVVGAMRLHLTPQTLGGPVVPAARAVGDYQVLLAIPALLVIPTPELTLHTTAFL